MLQSNINQIRKQQPVESHHHKVEVDTTPPIVNKTQRSKNFPDSSRSSSPITQETEHIYDYRFDGYWRIGQVFHHRNANDLDVKNYADDTCFLRGQLMKLTFAPVWVQMEERMALND